MNHKKIMMIFDHFLFLKRLRIAMAICVFLSNNAIAANSVPQKNLKINSKPQIFVRDYKYFRKYYYKDAEFVVNKINSKSKNIIFTQGEKVLSVTLNNEKAIYQLMVPGKTKRHFMLTKYEKNQKPKIGYYAVSRKTYFSDSVMPQAVSSNEKESQICSKGPNWSFGELKNIVKVLGDQKSNNFSAIDIETFVDKSCRVDDEAADELASALDNLFKKNAQEMFSCLQSDQAQKTLSDTKNINLLMNANMFVARMTRFLDDNRFKNADQAVGNQLTQKLNDKSGATKNMKIKCAPNKDLKNKSACFVDENENPAIVLDLTKIKQTASINKTDFKKEIQDILIHEFYHTSNQQMETSLEPGCSDEKIIQSLEALCPKSGKSAVIKVKETEVPKICPLTTDAENRKEDLVLDNIRYIKDGGAYGFIDQQARDNRANHDVKPDSSAGIIKTGEEIMILSTATLPSNQDKTEANDGARLPISGDSEIGNSLSGIYDSFAKNTSGLTSVLTNALATVAPTTAIANTNSSKINSSLTVMSASEIQSAQSGAEFNSKTTVDNSVNVQQIETSSKSTLNTSPSVVMNSSQSSNLAEKKNLEVLNSTTASVQVVNKNDEVSNQIGLGVSNIKAIPKSAFNIVNSSNSVSANQSQRQVASVDYDDSDSNRKNTDNKILQTLSISQRISGSSYAEVKTMYQNPEFTKSLELRGIAIEMNDSQKTRIGSKKPQIIFFDDGLILRKTK